MAKGRRGGGRRAAGGTPGVMPAQLRRSYVSGKVAGRVRWGVGGDFKRCTRQAAKHGVPKRMQNGMCAKLHRAATGTWPGKGRSH